MEFSILLFQIQDSIPKGLFGDPKIDYLWTTACAVSAAVGGLVTWFFTNKKNLAEIEKTYLEVSEKKYDQMEKLKKKKDEFDLVKKKIQENILIMQKAIEEDDIINAKNTHILLQNMLKSEFVKSINSYVETFQIFNEKNKSGRERFVTTAFSLIESIKSFCFFLNNEIYHQKLQVEKIPMTELDFTVIIHYINDNTKFYQLATKNKIKRINNV
jgi:hypothetical protein